VVKKVLVTCAGIMAIDIILADLPKVCQPGELVFAPKGILLHIGGHAANVPIDLIKLGLRRDEVSTIGTVGKDLYGDFIESILAEHGIQIHMMKIEEAGTAKSVILVVRGEDRRVYHDVGANYFLDPDYVKAILREERPLIFYVGATGLLGRFDEQLFDVLKVAKAQNCLTFVDPVIPYQHGWEHIREALELVDVFHCNNFEASDMTGISDFCEALRSISEEGAKLAIVSTGEKGLVAAAKKMVFEMPAFKVPVVDPTGAGDAFCAGIIQALVEIDKLRNISKLSTNNIVDILLRGEAAGAACVTGMGTTTSVTVKKVNELMLQQGLEIRKRAKVL
jgi:sugar/nucleoside kinase (ribokinase family)